MSVQVLIVGGGMYVTGRGTGGDGTIGPAVVQAALEGGIAGIALATTRPESAQRAQADLARMAGALGTDVALRSFADWRQAAEVTKPDCAVICVPDAAHAEIAVDLCARGVHCLVVKPMAPTVAEARAMVESAERAGVYGAIEFHKRLDRANLEIREQLRSGALGTPLYATVAYSQPKRIPESLLRSWAAETSIFQYLGVHYVDLLQWAGGFLPMRVTAWGQREHLRAAGLDTWDSMQVVIEWQRPDGGPFVSMHATSWVDPDCSSALSDQRIHVVGTRGRIDSDQKHRGLQVVRDGEGVHDLNPWFSVRQSDERGRARYSGYGIDSVRGFLDDVDGLRAGRLELAELVYTRPSFQQGIVSTAVVEAAHQSLASGSVPAPVDL